VEQASCLLLVLGVAGGTPTPLSLISPPEMPASSRFRAWGKPAHVGGTGQRERWALLDFWQLSLTEGSDFALARLTFLLAKGLDELEEKGALEGLCSEKHAGESKGQSAKNWNPGTVLRNLG